jgi:1-acyl-sn-glycerol-3-phosphate acyltransferase
VVAEILDPIPPGLDKDTFFARLQNDIESATSSLIAEGRAKMGTIDPALD